MSSDFSPVLMTAMFHWHSGEFERPRRFEQNADTSTMPSIRIVLNGTPSAARPISSRMWSTGSSSPSASHCISKCSWYFWLPTAAAAQASMMSIGRSAMQPITVGSSSPAGTSASAGSRWPYSLISSAWPFFK